MSLTGGIASSATRIEIAQRPRSRPYAEMSRSAMLLCQTTVGIAVLLLWQLASGRLLDNFFISNPLDVSLRLWNWTTSGFIFVHLWVTFYETVAGFVFGSVIGVLLGIWLGVAVFMSRLLNPFLFGFYALPKIALAPLFVLWFGLGMESKIALSTIIVFFLVFFNTYAGVREVDLDLINSVRLMKGTQMHLLRHVIVPSSMGWIFAGLKISVPYALIGAIVGELIASNQGLGFLVQFAGAEFDTTGVFAVLVVIGLLAVGLNFVVDISQRRLERWKIVSH